MEKEEMQRWVAIRYLDLKREREKLSELDIRIYPLINFVYDSLMTELRLIASRCLDMEDELGYINWEEYLEE
jgi:hypothetical protein